MARYQIWDKVSDVYTPGRDENGKSVFTAQEWADRFPWVNIPGAKMIISAGKINGGVALEFDTTVAQYKHMGAGIPDDWQELNAKGTLTDEQILAAIEDYEDNPPGSDEPSIEERTAAALEFIALNSLPDNM